MARKSIAFLAAVCLFSFAALPAQADNVPPNKTGQYIWQQCKQIGEVDFDIKKATAQDGVCIGLLIGLTAAYQSYEPGQLCAPDSASNSDDIKLFLSYLEAHPQEHDEHYYTLLKRALKHAYPCE